MALGRARRSFDQKRDDFGAELALAAEAGECEMSVGESGQRADGGRGFARLESGDGWQTEQLFGEEAVEFAGRQQEVVGEVVLHALHAACAEVTDPAALDGSGFAGESGETVTAGMAGEVNQDVDSVCANLVGEGVVGEADDLVPVLKVVAEALGHRVFEDVIGIGVELKAGLADEMGERRLDEVRHGVDAEIGGDETDLQGSFGITKVGVREPAGAQRRLEAFADTKMLSEERLRGGVGVVAEAEEQVGVRVHLLGIEFDGAAITGFGLFQASLLLQASCEVGVGVGVVGFDFNRPPVGGLGLGQPV